MGLIVYPALVVDADPAALSATFPDLPGLVAQAATPAELLLRSRETLMEALRALEKAGDGWPAASTLAEVRRAHPEHDGGVIWIDVEVEDTPVRITISMGERLVARIDQAAGELAMTRSGYLAAAARRQMASGRSPLETPAEQRILEEVAAAGRKIHDTLGPHSPVGRTLAELDALALEGLRHVADGVAGAVRGRRRAAAAAPPPDADGAARPASSEGAGAATGEDADAPPGSSPPLTPEPMTKTARESRPPGAYTRGEAVDMSPAQRRAALVATALLFAAGLWTLHEFLPALIWAVVIAVGVWPLFDRAGRRWPQHRKTLLPAGVVLAILVVFVIPLTLVAVPVAQDAHGAADFIAHARQSGVPAPPILGQLPYGERLTALWQADLGRPGYLDEFSSRLAQGQLVGFGRRAAQEAAHRAVLFGFTLLALFMLLREADAVVGQLQVASRRAFGPAGERVGLQMVRSVHGTVNGLVLVGLAEGAVMTVAYFAVGAPHAALFGLFTALLAMVPFGAAAAFVIAAAVLLAVGKVVGAVVVVAVGFVVTFVADHVFRPVLIGGATKLPFVWVLLGILGGVTAFGLLGLFVGPAVLAALILLWREWVGSEPGPINPEPAATQGVRGAA